VPFQRSTTGFLDGVEPTVMHTRADGHETAFSAAVTGTRARTVAPNVAALPVPAPPWAPPAVGVAVGAPRAGPVHAVVSTAVTRTPAAASHRVPDIRLLAAGNRPWTVHQPSHQVTTLEHGGEFLPVLPPSGTT
jgi:hypothetical protein